MDNDSVEEITEETFSRKFENEGKLVPLNNTKIHRIKGIQSPDESMNYSNERRKFAEEESESGFECDGKKRGRVKIRRRRRRRRRSRSRSKGSETSSDSSATTNSDVNSDASAISGTWHEHVYAAPPRLPTAHMISDIMGWTRPERAARTTKTNREQLVNDTNSDDTFLNIERLVAPTSSGFQAPTAISRPLIIEESPKLSRLTGYPLEPIGRDFSPSPQSLTPPTSLIRISDLTSKYPPDDGDLRPLAVSKLSNENLKLERRTVSKLSSTSTNKLEDVPLNLTVTSRSKDDRNDVDTAKSNRVNLHRGSLDTLNESRVTIDSADESFRGPQVKLHLKNTDAAAVRDDKDSPINLGTPVSTIVKGTAVSSAKSSSTKGRKLNCSNEPLVGEKSKKEARVRLDSLAEDANLSDQKRKKTRTTFTGNQIFALEKQFETKKYLSSSERVDMANMLNVTETQVKIWFQNRRTKWKKQDNISNAEAAEYKNVTNPKLVLLGKAKSVSGDKNKNSDSPSQVLKSEGDPKNLTNSDQTKPLDYHVKRANVDDSGATNGLVQSSRDTEMETRDTDGRHERNQKSGKIENNEDNIIENPGDSGFSVDISNTNENNVKNEIFVSCSNLEVEEDFSKIDQNAVSHDPIVSENEDFNRKIFEKSPVIDGNITGREKNDNATQSLDDNVRTKDSFKSSPHESPVKNIEVYKCGEIDSANSLTDVDAMDRTFRADHSS